MDKRNPEAIRAYNKALAVNPDFGPALEGAVNAEMAANRDQDALARVKKYIEKDPKQSLPWLLQAEVHLKLKDNNAAQTDLETVISLDPKLPFPYLMLARIYVDQHKQDDALARLNKLVSLTNSVPALMQIGMIHDAMGQYEPAKTAYTTLLDVNPLFGAALNNLAYLYSEHFNDVDKAKEVAEKARELYPADPYVADTLGWILYKKHDYSRALSLMEESMDRQPNDGEIHYHVGMAQYMLGEDGPARVNLKFALSKMSFGGTNDALAHFNILSIDPKNATSEQRSELADHLKNEPKDPIALACLAGIQERDGDSEKAAATYQNALDLTPDNARVTLRLALLNSTKLNQPAKALELAKRANNLAPDDPYIAAALGRMEFQAHDYLHARDVLDSAARLLPSQPDVHHDLAWADFSVGQISEAQAAMQTAVQSGTPFDKLPDAKQFLEMISVCNNPAQPDAAANVKKVLQADANYAPALLASCVLEEHQGHLKESAAACDKLLATYPQCVAAIRLLALVNTEDGSDDTKAYANVTKAMEAFPDDFGLNKAKGMIEYRRNDYRKSLQSLETALARNTNDAELLLYTGLDQLNLHQTNDAKKTITLALKSKLPKPLEDQAKTALTQIH
jgi:tetratricopeptide (TPR) repeat protein